eukprot:3616126-Rhodomonas_salina.1
MPTLCSLPALSLYLPTRGFLPEPPPLPTRDRQPCPALTERMVAAAQRAVAEGQDARRQERHR